MSLRETVPEAYRSFTDVWATHATDEEVYFSTSDALFRWDGQEMAVWHSEWAFGLSFLVDGTLYVRERGPVRMEPTAAGGSLRLVPGGERSDLEPYLRECEFATITPAEDVLSALPAPMKQQG